MSPLITFKSRACADVTMGADTARTLLTVIGKTAGERGVITPEEIPAALARLDAAMRAGKEHDGELARNSAGATPHATDAIYVATVAIDQRAWPMREMLRQSGDAKTDILWGV